MGALANGRVAAALGEGDERVSAGELSTIAERIARLRAHVQLSNDEAELLAELLAIFEDEEYRPAALGHEPWCSDENRCCDERS